MVLKFETREDVLEYLSGDLVECLVCGKEYKSLACHTRQAHDMTKDEYCIEFGIPKGFPLCSSSLSEKISSAAKAAVDNSEGRREMLTERMLRVRPVGGRKGISNRAPSLKQSKSNKKNLEKANKIFGEGCKIAPTHCHDCGKEILDKTNIYIAHRKKPRCHKCKTVHANLISKRTKSNPKNKEKVLQRARLNYQRIRNDPALWDKELKRRRDSKRRARAERKDKPCN